MNLTVVQLNDSHAYFDLHAEDMPNFAALLDHADQALYAAKEAGRNRVETWERGRYD